MVVCNIKYRTLRRIRTLELSVLEDYV
jgi:hypothetical protein